MDVLTSLFIEKGIPDHIRSDNGSEFTAKPIRAWLKRLGVKTLYIVVFTPKTGPFSLRENLVSLT